MAKEGTTTLPCKCTDKDQDKIYGLGKRLHNLGFAKGKPNGKAKCTVCGNINKK